VSKGDSTTSTLSCPLNTYHIIIYHVSVQPYHIIICHISVWPYHIITCMDCMDCTVSKFLPVWKIEQNVISHSSNVCLTLFEVRWVRDDEAYTPIQFEAILSTFNFEQNLIQ
jgi:hypothetical protein